MGEEQYRHTQSMKGHGAGGLSPDYGTSTIEGIEGRDIRSWVDLLAALGDQEHRSPGGDANVSCVDGTVTDADGVQMLEGVLHLPERHLAPTVVEGRVVEGTTPGFLEDRLPGFSVHVKDSLKVRRVRPTEGDQARRPRCVACDGAYNPVEERIANPRAPIGEAVEDDPTLVDGRCRGIGGLCTPGLLWPRLLHPGGHVSFRCWVTKSGPGKGRKPVSMR